MPGLGRSPGERNGNPLQYSCLENPMDGGAWWATVHGVAKSRTRLSDNRTELNWSTREIMYSVRNVMTNSVCCVWQLREYILNSHHKAKKFFLCLLFCTYMRWWMFIQLIVVIISWCMDVKSFAVCLKPGFYPWVRKIHWRRKWQFTLVLVPGKSHGERSLVGCCPWGRTESDTTEAA